MIRDSSQELVKFIVASLMLGSEIIDRGPQTENEKFFVHALDRVNEIILQNF